MRIGELADRTHVPARLLRYYEEQGLLSPQREANGYRDYPEALVERVIQIRGLLDAGVPTRIIKDILPCLDTPCSITVTDASAELLATLRRERDQLDARVSCLARNRDAITTYLNTVSERPPVLPEHLAQAVDLAVRTLREAPADAWDATAGGLEWDCWETVEHLSDDLFAYAVQLGPKSPPLTGNVPFLWEARRPGGPRNAVHADRSAGPEGLLQVLEASGALLVAMVRTAPSGKRAFHSNGVSDPEGFAAMGIVETLVHTHDLAEGLGLHWDPPSGLCTRALARLFPEAPTTTVPWPTLLWATGRGELPGRPRRASWTWRSEPLG
ncbi:DNA-binding transcriptional regulator, MerR family [Allokutzneria albata]|uniref:DNA-binding transcriptional regulator, MerR family n=1 Tax=Allokutzneria albata TaxID=211114 RepID=A0A1G9SS36_ALLAB|nr:DNA-binding transcriptional regulator, MerR family [Allokutzneria albata]